MTEVHRLSDLSELNSMRPAQWSGQKPLAHGFPAPASCKRMCVCVCEGSWTFMKRQQLKARVVSKKEVKRTTGGGKKGWGRREDEREGVADIGRA